MSLACAFDVASRCTRPPDPAEGQGAGQPGGVPGSSGLMSTNWGLTGAPAAVAARETMAPMKRSKTRALMTRVASGRRELASFRTRDGKEIVNDVIASPPCGSVSLWRQTHEYSSRAIGPLRKAPHPMRPDCGHRRTLLVQGPPLDADRPEESFERGPVRLPAHGHAFLERLARAARQISRALIALLTASDLVWTWSLS